MPTARTFADHYCPRSNKHGRNNILGSVALHTPPFDFTTGMGAIPSPHSACCTGDSAVSGLLPGAYRSCGHQTKFAQRSARRSTQDKILSRTCHINDGKSLIDMVPGHAGTGWHNKFGASLVLLDVEL